MCEVLPTRYTVGVLLLFSGSRKTESAKTPLPPFIDVQEPTMMAMPMTVCSDDDQVGQ